jgi:hypothetical protein
MITLELSAEQAELLHQIVERELRELGPEIRHTDSRTYRDHLKQRFDALETLRARLAQLSSRQ